MDEEFLPCLLHLAIDVEGAIVECASALALNVPDVIGIVEVYYHLEALSLVVGAQEKPGAQASVVVHVDLHSVVAKLPVAQ